MATTTQTPASSQVTIKARVLKRFAVGATVYAPGALVDLDEDEALLKHLDGSAEIPSDSMSPIRAQRILDAMSHSARIQPPVYAPNLSGALRPRIDVKAVTAQSNGDAWVEAGSTAAMDEEMAVNRLLEGIVALDTATLSPDGTAYLWALRAQAAVRASSPAR